MPPNEPDPKYGLYLGPERHHVDQVPWEVSQFGKRSYNDKGEGECWVVGSKVDMTKRQFTLMPCFRADVPDDDPMVDGHGQNVKPALIVRGKPRITKDGKVNARLPHCNSAARRAEIAEYDDSVNVYWDPKAMAGPNVMDAWLEDYDEQTRCGRGVKRKRRLLGLDNWGPQKAPPFQRKAKRRRIKLAYTPEDCTDLVAVIDDGPGNELKKRMVKYYGEDLSSSDARLEAWKNVFKVFKKLN